MESDARISCTSEFHTQEPTGGCQLMTWGNDDPCTRGPAALNGVGGQELQQSVAWIFSGLIYILQLKFGFCF